MKNEDLIKQLSYGRNPDGLFLKSDMKEVVLRMKELRLLGEAPYIEHLQEQGKEVLRIVL